MKRFCKYCGAENNGEARFCEGCGKELSALQEDDVLCCPNCGMPLKLTDTVCPQCGEGARGLEIPDSYGKPKQTFINSNSAYHVSRSPVIKWVIGMGIAVVFIVICGIYLLGNSVFGIGANRVESFDYSTTFSVMGKDNPAIRYDGFVNNGGKKIDSRDDAIAAAKLEGLPAGGETFKVYHDKENDIWAVHFGEASGHPVVYINEDGQTVAILNG